MRVVWEFGWQRGEAEKLVRLHLYGKTFRALGIPLWHPAARLNVLDKFQPSVHPRRRQTSG